MEPATTQFVVAGLVMILAYAILGRLGKKSLLSRHLHDSVIPLLLGLWSLAAFLLGGLFAGFP